MHSLELKVPPPIVAFVIAVLMWLLARATPSFNFALPGNVLLAGIVILVGLALGISGKVAFGRARTTVNPMKPARASSLVVSGVYKFTRNPMYLGMLFDLVGICIYLSNPLTFALMPVYVMYLNRFQIEPEERTLSTLFGREFLAYKAKVRRWI